MTRNQQECWLNCVEKDQQTIIENIIAARMRNGLGQEWVAENAGYSIDQYRLFERGERNLDLEDIYRISTVIADYADSQQPFLVRISRKFKEQSAKDFSHAEDVLIAHFPATEEVFDHISLQKLTHRMLFWLTLFILYKNAGYQIGYVVGKVVRGIQDVLDLTVIWI